MKETQTPFVPRSSLGANCAPATATTAGTPSAGSIFPAGGAQEARTWASFGWFILSGGACFVVGTGLLYLATDVCKIHYLLSTIGCSLLCGALGFSLNRRFAFRERASRCWPELGRYYLVNLGSLALNVALMALCVSGLGLPYLSASMGLSILLTVFNFLLHRNWSFRAG